MRLTQEEILIIKESIHQLDPKAKIYLFGSRVDVKKRGGDIDLLILSKILTPKDTLTIKHSFFKEMEEQKVDIVISKNKSDPFVQIALKSSILL